MSHISQEYLSSENSFISQEDTVFTAEFYRKLLGDLKDESLAWQISYDFGGERIYIPKVIKEGHAYREYGEAFCRWLADNYGGEYVIIPQGPLNETKRINRKARLLAKQGYSNNQIVRMLRIHHRTAQRIKSQLAHEQQLKLL